MINLLYIRSGLCKNVEPYTPPCIFNPQMVMKVKSEMHSLTRLLLG